MPHAHRSLDCFGTRCAVQVGGSARGRSAIDAVDGARAALLSWHRRFTRFTADSELARLNADPRATVPVSPLMARFTAAARSAAELTGGLVDPTLLREIEDAGYRSDLGPPFELDVALRLARGRRPAAPRPDARWRAVVVDVGRGVVSRPGGLALDSGGVAKGLFADVLGERLAGHASFVVDCGGDLRVGGSAGRPRPVDVRSPFGSAILHRFLVRTGGVATSSIGRRSWLDPAGRPAHHLLDPSTGRPAFTGVVQATALAPTAVEAEARAKAAVLAGPLAAPDWLAHGGLLVFDDASHLVVDERSTAPPRGQASRLLLSPSTSAGRFAGHSPSAADRLCQAGAVRLVTFSEGSGAARPGRLEGDHVQPLAAPSLVAWLACGHGASDAGDPLPAAGVQLLAPVPDPPSIRDFYAFEGHVAAGWRRRGGEVPPAWYEAPAFYFSNPASVVGPGATVRRPAATAMLDFELEVAAVIGADGEIAGFTLMNDWSARDVQAREMTVGLGPAKGKDFATSLGPWLVTPDALPYSGGRLDVAARVTVNGETVTETTTADQHFTWPELVAHAARATVLRPGDVIGSGTLNRGCLLEIGPLAGDRWLEPGDEVALHADGLGTLSATIG